MKNGRADPAVMIAYKNYMGPLLTFIDNFFEFVSGSEFGDSTCCYFNGRTCLWVSAVAGLAL
jgi:hypothetical protein